MARRARGGRRAAGRERAAVSKGRERDGRARRLRRGIVAHPPPLRHAHLDAVLPLGRVAAAARVVFRGIQLGEQIWVVRPGEVRQVERGVIVRVACAERADQFALCRWHVPEAVAVGIRQTVVAAGRVGIDVVKRAGVRVDRQRGRDATIRVAVGRRTARCAWTRRWCLRGVAATMSAAAATAASVMPGALANDVGFHRDWTGRTVQFET